MKNALMRWCCIREAVERRWADAGVEPNARAEINAPALRVQAVRDGLGLSVLPSCGIDVAVQPAPLAVPLADGSLTRTVHIATSRLYPPPPTAASMLEMLRRLMLSAADN